MNLNEQLKKHHITLKKKFGQNFLTDPALLARIADVCDWQEGNRALEIGPGAGALTRAISERAEEMLTIEIDQRLAPLLQETLAECPNAKLVFGDALKTDLDALVAKELDWDGPYKLVANLPYYITTPLIMHVLEDCQRVDELVIMVQKEVGERLCSAPGSRAYGAVTVMVQYLGTIERAFDVGRRAFSPPPDVDSTILHLVPYKERPLQAKDDKVLRRVIKAAFSQRRKTLRNSLSAYCRDKDIVNATLEQVGIAPERRAESLSVAEFVALADAFYEQGAV